MFPYPRWDAPRRMQIPNCMANAGIVESEVGVREIASVWTDGEIPRLEKGGSGELMGRMLPC